MSLSSLSIRRPVFAWMLMAALIIFGYLSFLRLGVSQLPDVDSPVVSVSLSLPGAAPEVMENQVIDPVEDSIMQISGIRSISSTSQQSSGRISVEFELDRDIDVAVQEVQNHIFQLMTLLLMEPPNDLAPDTIRTEKVKVLKGLRPITYKDIHQYTVRGQYAAGVVDGKPVRG